MHIDNIPFYKVFCDELYDKKQALYKHKDDIKTLVIGSSQCNYGVDPKYFDSCTFNFSSASMDFFTIYSLIKIYGPQLSNLENIIIRIGIFCPGYDLSKTGESWRCYYYKKILGVPYDVDAESKEFEEYENQLQERKIEDDFLGYNKQTWFASWNVKERYQGHLKNFCRNDTSLKWLSLMDKWCVENKKRFIVIITPHRSDYVNESSNSIIKLLQNYVHEYAPCAEFYNFFYDKDFTDDDFGDTDHMKETGAEKLSKKLNEIINNKKKKEYNISLYLFLLALSNLPLIQRFFSYDYIQKIRYKCKIQSFPCIAQYDMICSLGGNCAAAMQADFRGLRKYSLPFDYLFMKDEQTIKYLLNGFKNKFSDFFLRENMVELVGDERGDDRHGCVQYKDMLSGYRAIHAFKEHVENNVEHYNEVMSMFRRRFDRMFEKIENSDRVAFILATPFSFDLKLLKPLQKYLSKKYPHKTIDWYVVQFACEKNDAKMFKLKTGVMYFYSYTRENNFDDFAKKDLPE